MSSQTELRVDGNDATTINPAAVGNLGQLTFSYGDDGVTAGSYDITTPAVTAGNEKEHLGSLGITLRDASSNILGGYQISRFPWMSSTSTQTTTVEIEPEDLTRLWDEVQSVNKLPSGETGKLQLTRWTAADNGSKPSPRRYAASAVATSGGAGTNERLVMIGGVERASGVSESRGGHVQYSDDGGASWVMNDATALLGTATGREVAFRTKTGDAGAEAILYFGTGQAIFYSLDQGATWTELVADDGLNGLVPYPGSAVYDPVGDKIYVFGGKRSGSYVNEIHSLDCAAFANHLLDSNNAAPTFQKMNVTPEWGARGRTGAQVMSDGKVLLFGGEDPNDNTLYDIWESGAANGSPDFSVPWTKKTDSSPLGQRPSALRIPGTDVILGWGSAKHNHLDSFVVWKTSDRGASWTPVSHLVGTNAHYGVSEWAMDDGQIVRAGGYHSGTTEGAHADWEGKYDNDPGVWRKAIGKTGTEQWSLLSHTVESDVAEYDLVAVPKISTLYAIGETVLHENEEVDIALYTSIPSKVNSGVFGNIYAVLNNTNTLTHADTKNYIELKYVEPNGNTRNLLDETGASFDGYSNPAVTRHLIRVKAIRDERGEHMSIKLPTRLVQSELNDVSIIAGEKAAPAVQQFVGTTVTIPDVASGASTVDVTVEFKAEMEQSSLQGSMFDTSLSGGNLTFNQHLSKGNLGKQYQARFDIASPEGNLALVFQPEVMNTATFGNAPNSKSAVAGELVGDPYVASLRGGQMTKLPVEAGAFRLLQGPDITVNGIQQVMSHEDTYAMSGATQEVLDEVCKQSNGESLSFFRWFVVALRGAMLAIDAETLNVYAFAPNDTVPVELAEAIETGVRAPTTVAPSHSFTLNRDVNHTKKHWISSEVGEATAMYHWRSAHYMAQMARKYGGENRSVENCSPVASLTLRIPTERGIMLSLAFATVPQLPMVRNSATLSVDSDDVEYVEATMAGPLVSPVVDTTQLRVKRAADIQAIHVVSASSGIQTKQDSFSTGLHRAYVTV